MTGRARLSTRSRQRERDARVLGTLVTYEPRPAARPQQSKSLFLPRGRVSVREGVFFEQSEG